MRKAFIQPELEIIKLSSVEDFLENSGPTNSVPEGWEDGSDDDWA